MGLQALLASCHAGHDGVNAWSPNYINSLNHEVPAGGFSCPGACENNRGDEGVSCYPCKNSIIENNIVENFTASYTIQGKNEPFNNQYLGNIAMNGGGFGFGARAEVAPNSPNQMPTNTVLENNLVYHSDNWAGFGCRTCKNTQMTNNTVLDSVGGPPHGGFGGVMWDMSCGSACGEGGDGAPTGYATNTLVVNSLGAAFDINNVADWSVGQVWSYNNPGGAPDGAITSDPNLGTCKAWIPDNSPAKSAAGGGQDIGANVLHRYKCGQLTSEPLWNRSTGQFACGAVVPGVNDISGSSCSDVNERLNINTNGCSFPAGY
jgi:hypothetical protein